MAKASSKLYELYTMLFFLPIYYRVVKEQPKITTGLLLLPQTLAIAPCAGLVFVLVELVGLSYRWTVVWGWLCTASGVAMLTMLGTSRSVSSDILLNLLSGFGIGILMPALALSAKEGAGDMESLQASMLLVFMRSLGSGAGLIVTGIIFQHALRHNLELTKFQNQASEMTKYATRLMYSIREMQGSEDKQILLHATEASLRMVWVTMTVVSFVVFILSCFTILPAEQKQVDSIPPLGTNSPPQLELDQSVIECHEVNIGCVLARCSSKASNISERAVPKPL
jgi:hypothetical protein